MSRGGLGYERWLPLAWRAVWLGVRVEDREAVCELCRATPPGGFVLFARHLPDLETGLAWTRTIHAASQGLTRVAIDEEGGPVRRLPLEPGFPGAESWTERSPVELETAAAALGAVLRAIGVAVDFAPVADLGLRPNQPALRGRCYSAAPWRAAEYVAAFVRGLRRAGVAATLKHFPGHGDVAVDTHEEVGELEVPLEEARRREWVPFRAGIATGAELVMSAHVRWRPVDPVAIATWSQRVLGLLRHELGFTGLILTDDLAMGGAAELDPAEAAVRSIVAGADGVLWCHDLATAERIAMALATAAAADEVVRVRLAEASARLAALPQAVPCRDARELAPLLERLEQTLVQGTAS